MFDKSRSAKVFKTWVSTHALALKVSGFNASECRKAVRNILNVGKRLGNKIISIFLRVILN